MTFQSTWQGMRQIKLESGQADEAQTCVPAVARRGGAMPVYGAGVVSGSTAQSSSAVTMAAVQSTSQSDTAAPR